tara:strand:- start:127 stop:336 length:210 start_codon:yes stop_codon:yes gene_type:complete
VKILLPVEVVMAEMVNLLLQLFLVQTHQVMEYLVLLLEDGFLAVEVVLITKVILMEVLEVLAVAAGVQD